MTYPTEPRLAVGHSAVGQLLHDRFDREAVKLLLIGNPAAVEQCIIELERKGFCDSYAWSASLPIHPNSAIVVPRPGEQMRLYKRWYPPTVQRIPL